MEPSISTRDAKDAKVSKDPQDERLSLLQEVLASSTFARSARLSKFLETICTMSLEGRVREINEQQIGVMVFGRSPTYSAADDSIVRTQARQLRQRLEEYFERENPHSRLVISIPRGGYAPVFEPTPEAIKPTTPETVVSAEALAPSAARSPWISRLRTVALVALGFLLGVTLILLRKPPGPPADPLWTPFFSSGRPVLIVPSDDALVLLQEASRTPVTLNEYRNGSWLNQPNSPLVAGGRVGPAWFAAHQYTSTADLNLALRLGRLPFARQATVESRNARDLRIDDLKQNNVVLIGGSGSNPWVELFNDELNFTVHWDWKRSQGYVLNRHPAANEAERYEDDPSVSTPKSYGVLAYLPGIDGNGQALLFEGTGMAGTESAADFPFSDELFSRFKRTIGGTGNSLPYFEVLLETSSLGGNAPEARVVAYRLLHAAAPNEAHPTSQNIQ